MRKLDIYVAGSLLLLVSLYLKSPVVAMGSVLLWAVAVAENVLSRSTKDAEIVALTERLDKLDREHGLLTADIRNVAERSKTILGEVY